MTKDLYRMTTVMEVKTDIITSITESLIGLLIDFIVFNATFSNISAISW